MTSWITLVFRRGSRQALIFVVIRGFGRNGTIGTQPNARLCLFWFSFSMVMPWCLVSEARGNGLGQGDHVSDPDRIMDVSFFKVRENG
jgi:hypothetical protein